jgi:hypothetical protein
MFMFASVYFNWPRSYHSEILDRAMGFWVSALHDSGVDLKEYGQRESLIWASLGESGEDKAEYIEYTTGGTSDYYFGDRRLLGFCYGPFPEDWRVWENEPTDEFAGDFWLMLDKIVEVMPGTWIE